MLVHLVSFDGMPIGFNDAANFKRLAEKLTRKSHGRATLPRAIAAIDQGRGTQRATSSVMAPFSADAIGAPNAGSAAGRFHAPLADQAIGVARATVWRSCGG
jgi:hypothetical protein